MFFYLTPKQEKDLRKEVYNYDDGWYYKTPELRADACLVLIFVNKNQNRLVFIQYTGFDIIEINTGILGLDVSDKESLKNFLCFVNEELPLRFNKGIIKNSLRKTVWYLGRKVKKMFIGNWRPWFSEGLAEV